MTKFKNFIKDLFSLVSNVRQLENDVENLEKRVLAPEEVNRGYGYYTSLFYDSFLWGHKRREISLEEKVEAIAKALNIRFELTQEQESEVVAKLPRRQTKKKRMKKS